MIDAYDPLTAPLEFPVQLLTVHCLARTPLHFRPGPGSTPGTTLNGTFGTVLWERACLRQQQGQPACNASTNSPQCQQPDHCPVHWLYKPYSRVHRRDLTRPVLFRCPDLQQDIPVSDFTLTVTLWGRHAIAAREAVEQTLEAMGAAGLGGQPGSPRVPFQVTEITAEPPQTLMERADALSTSPRQQALLVFETPFLHREPVQVSEDERKKLFLAGGDLPLTAILGNCAYELTAWDMEDRSLDEALDGQTRHHLAREAREAARALAEPLQIEYCDLNPVALGPRYSKSNGRQYPLLGFIGQAGISGPLDPVLPWLLALSLGGGGQKRAMGFGTVRLWLGP